MESLAGCQLGISIYPTFSYNASGGGGIASATQSAENPSRVDVVFDPKAVTIPDVSSSNVIYAERTFGRVCNLGHLIPPRTRLAMSLARTGCSTASISLVST